MEAVSGVVLALVVLAIVLVVVPRLMGGNAIRCNRCDGTGQIDERWPDPKEPTGFHMATGKCPKCKGKGRVKP